MSSCSHGRGETSRACELDTVASARNTRRCVARCLHGAWHKWERIGLGQIDHRYGSTSSVCLRSRSPVNRPPEAPSKISLIRFEPTPKGLALTALALALAWVALRLAPVMLVLVVALMLVGTLNPVVEWLEKKSWRRGWAIGFVFSIMLVVALSLMALTIPSLV